MSSTPSPLIDTAEAPSPTTSEQIESQAFGAALPEEKPARGSLYRVIWRWHFYAGLITAPIVLVAALTGAIYTFHNELEGWIIPGTIVAPESERLTFDEQRARLIEQAPEATDLDSISITNDPRRSTKFIVHLHPGGDANAEQQHRIYLVNPYNGELLGSHLMESEFFHVVLDLHRSLFAGSMGRLLVELATSWGIVLVITGVYLWWPRGSRRGAGVWWPRLRAKPYVILRDLHAIAGTGTALFAVIILFTGLFVSLVFGGAFNAVSTKMNQSLMGFLMPAAAEPIETPVETPTLETLMQNALEYSQPGDGVYVQFAQADATAHKVFLMHDGDTNTVRGLDLHPQTGEVIAATMTDELTPLVRFLAIAVSLHQGKTFGMPSKIIAFLTCLVLVAMCITGVWMWWDRRPRGRTGFPRRADAGRAPRWVWALVVVTGIVLPTVGVSILLILIGEWLVRRAVPAWRQA